MHIHWPGFPFINSLHCCYTFVTTKKPTLAYHYELNLNFVQMSPYFQSCPFSVPGSHTAFHHHISLSPLAYGGFSDSARCYDHDNFRRTGQAFYRMPPFVIWCFSHDWIRIWGRKKKKKQARSVSLIIPAAPFFISLVFELEGF